jgi:hypothetical protein
VQNGVPVFHTRLKELEVYINELKTTLDIQEFAAWLTIRKRIPYLCILDESDKPIEGWQATLRPYLKQGSLGIPNVIDNTNPILLYSVFLHGAILVESLLSRLAC